MRPHNARRRALSSRSAVSVSGLAVPSIVLVSRCSSGRAGRLPVDPDHRPDRLQTGLAAPQRQPGVEPPQCGGVVVHRGGLPRRGEVVLEGDGVELGAVERQDVAGRLEAQPPVRPERTAQPGGTRPQRGHRPGGGDSPHIATTRRSAETTRPASTSSAARSARGLGPPRTTGPLSSSTVSGPSIPNCIPPPRNRTKPLNPDGSGGRPSGPAAAHGRRGPRRRPVGFSLIGGR